MRGELYIDGKDAYTDFGVWITEGGYDGLLPFPELVEPRLSRMPMSLCFCIAMIIITKIQRRKILQK